MTGAVFILAGVILGILGVFTDRQDVDGLVPLCMYGAAGIMTTIGCVGAGVYIGLRDSAEADQRD